MKLLFVCTIPLVALIFGSSDILAQQKKAKPNVILIYTDDLGYGDLSCYGATKLQTPNIDRLAGRGLRFTRAYTTSATCTPSRYALMTGQYPWRKSGTGVLPGDAALIVPTDKTSLPKVFRQAGYRTGMVGKWHLGLGTAVAKNWNGEIKPGPNEVGFDYSFIFPATADRVPTVFVENHQVVALDPADPIEVNYKEKIGDEPTGKEHPQLLKMKASPNHGHDQTIVNGIGRIGYMKGGKTARWTDEEMPLTFLSKAEEFISAATSEPFFLFYSLTEPHVPRMPSTMFKGKSGLGFRGDAILQIDWAVGEILKALENSGKAANTLIIFSSDNGPVLDDGYEDGAVTQLNGHRPAGVLRGGKYSILEAGTRVPFIVYHPKLVKPGISDALVSQVDLLSSFANFLGVPLPPGDAQDSQNQWAVLNGRSAKGRVSLVLQGASYALVQDNWKYIAPSKGPAVYQLTNIESGHSEQPQLYDLSVDPGERVNLAERYPDKVKELAAALKAVTAGLQ
ncbi:MAG: sulfatase-like hydrolase/transferase [Flavipsychrobacter sp.]|nr:sulfatase-like hydrolase/transferase [Flavipsychrobacter sp.]